MLKSNIGYRYKPLLAFALLGLVTLACGSYSRVSEQTISTATPVGSTTALDAAGPTQASQAAPSTPTVIIPTPPPATYLGDLVELDGYSLSAVTVEDPATRPGIFYEPQPGKKLVAVEFIVGNVAGDQFSSNVLRATLVDNDGFLYGAETGQVEDQMELLDVNPGERVRGWTAFFIPEGSQPAVLKYEFRGIVLEVGLSPR